MKAVIERDELRSALARVKPAVGKRGSVAALTAVLINASDGTLSLTATDLGVRISTSASAAVGDQGKALVPHAPLDSILGRCPKGAVTVSLDDGKLSVGAGRVSVELCTLEVASFPQPPSFTGYQEEKLDSDWKAIQRVLHARAVDDSKPELCQVRIGEHWAVATDSYRMARHPLELDADLLLPPGLAISAAKVCPEGPVVLRWDGRQAELEAAGTIWQSSTLDVGRYPSLATIDRLYPKKPPVSANVDRDELLEAVRVIEALGSEQFTAADGRKYTSCLVRLVIGGDTVTAKGERADIGSTEMALDARTAGEAGPVFRSETLRPMLEACREDDLLLRGTDELKPWVAEDGDLKVLVMPTRPT